MNLDNTLVTPLMRGVGHYECGISNDVARGAIKDRLLGYVSPSNHHTDHMSWMGSTSRVTNCDRFIRETGKGWHRSGMSGTLTEH
jgi:hypothetical protein